MLSRYLYWSTSRWNASLVEVYFDDLEFDTESDKRFEHRYIYHTPDNVSVLFTYTLV